MLKRVLRGSGRGRRKSPAASAAVAAEALATNGPKATNAARLRANVSDMATGDSLLTAALVISPTAATAQTMSSGHSWSGGEMGRAAATARRPSTKIAAM